MLLPRTLLKTELFYLEKFDSIDYDYYNNRFQYRIQTVGEEFVFVGVHIRTVTEGVFLLGTERDGTQAIARFRTHSGAKTACGVLSAGERRQTVENRSFPRFFHTKKRRSRSVENSGLLFSNLERDRIVSRNEL